MKRFSNRMYTFVKNCAHFLLRFAHPIAKYEGRENVPEGAAVVVANHTAFTDAVWLHVGIKVKRRPMTMAKKELMNTKILGAFCYKLGAFPVDREGNDIQAIKTSLQCLREDNKLVIFPEGTRIRKGKTAQAHNGAMMLACRANADILPVYVTAKKRFWRPIHVVVGKPYTPQYEGAKPTSQELDTLTKQMMQKVYALGEKYER